MRWNIIPTTMSKLEVAFHDPAAGSVRLALRGGGESADIVASYLYNGFLELTLALHRLLFTQGESVVTWQGDPMQYEMRFLRIEGTVYLEIEEFAENRRSTARGERLMFVTGTYEEICLPFWRALCSLQVRFPEEELAARWLGPFPWNEINKLSAEIKAEMHVEA